MEYARTYRRNRRPAPPAWLDATLALVIANAAVMVTVIMTGFVTGMLGDKVNLATWLDMPSGPAIMYRPWTVVTYMFTQTDVWHCIFNMLWFYWLGHLYAQFTSGRSLVWLYVTGGVAAAAVYWTAGMLWPGVTGMLPLEGASGAVMSVVAAVALTRPDYKINLLLFGQVKIKWVAVITVVIFACGLTGSSAGAHVAHLGGLAAGALWVLVPRLARALRPHNADDISQQYISEADARAELDRLLDRVRTSGYASLSANERRRLMDLSNKI